MSDSEISDFEIVSVISSPDSSSSDAFEPPARGIETRRMSTRLKEVKDEGLTANRRRSQSPARKHRKIVCACIICKKTQNDRLIQCKKCDKKGHIRCIMSSNVGSGVTWQCNRCVICSICQDITKRERIDYCMQCNSPLHFSCTKTLHSWMSMSNLKCRNCVRNKKPKTEIVNDEADDKTKLKQNLLNGNAQGSHARVISFDSDDSDEDPRLDWSINDVHDYFAASDIRRFAHVFKEKEIDGWSLKLLTRDDVINHFGLSLGSAIRVYHHILRFRRMFSRDNE